MKKRPAPRNKVSSIPLYELYENSVQSPDWHATHFPRFHFWMTGKLPFALREDFCGTARISCEWVTLSDRHTATGLDLDPEPLSWGKSVNLKRLKPEQQSRVRLLRQNVLKPTKDRYDLIAACNFSFFIFHTREAMLEYARALYRSLNPEGSVFLEMAGGEGMMEEIREPRYFRVPGYGRCRYVWEQHQYDPITSLSDYSIHFQLPNGRWMKDAFTYHWRLWGIREIREILEEAGFTKTHVFWETLDRDGEGTGEYAPLEKGDHSHSWIAYVAAVK